MNGQQLNEEALARVEANADESWKQTASLVVYLVARQNEYLTSDDVWHGLEGATVSTHEPRAMGAILKRAAKDGIIAATDDWRVSSRPECHGRPVRVWRSLTLDISSGLW